MARLPLLNIRLDPDDKARWTAAAQKDGRTLAGMIKRAVELYMAQILSQEKKSAPVTDRGLEGKGLESAGSPLRTSESSR